MSSVQLSWVKNVKNSQYFDFLRLDVNAAYFADKVGVYLIWYSAPSPGRSRVIRLGQGKIGERLREHLSNPQITQYASAGQLKVTWALVDGVNFKDTDLNGVESYLARVYNPILGDRFPNVPEIPVTPLV